jgi:hypothetical protein
MRLDAFEPLVGEWDTEIRWPGHDEPIRGATSFAWLEGGGYLVQRSSIDKPEFPNFVAVIGPPAGDPDRVVMHYFDSRGVARIYDAELHDGVLRLSRDDDPEFVQRYAGHFSADGRTVTGAWENCRDGTTWNHDFDVIQTKVA